MDKEGLTLEQIKEIYVGKINDTYTLNLAVAMLENYDELLNKLEEKDKEIGKLKAKMKTADLRINQLCEILSDEDYLTTYNIMQLQTAFMKIV